MELSTDIPRAILKIRMVEGLMGIPANPIRAAVISCGIRLGTSDIRIILQEVNKKASKIAITTTARSMLSQRFRIRKLVPFKKTTLVPVMVTVYFEGLKMESTFGFRLFEMRSISF